MPNQSEPTGRFDRAALRYLARVVDTDHPSDEPFVLNKNERRVIGWVKAGTIITSAALGMAGVLTFYLPHYAWPAWFTQTHVGSWTWPLISWLWLLLLLYIGWHLLSAMHRWAVRLVEITCQFPRYHDSHYGRHLKQLAEKNPAQTTLRLTFTPRPLLPWTMPGYLLTMILIGLVVNITIQLVTRYGLQYQSPMPTDMIIIGGSFFALINSWASYQILRQAQIRVMTPLTIRQFVNELGDEFGRDLLFQEMLPILLDYIGLPASQQHYGHLLLLESLTYRFNLGSAQTSIDFPEYLASCPEHIRQGLERLLIFCVLIDGHLSRSEEQQLHQLLITGGLKISVVDIKAMGHEYVAGRGLWV